MNDYMTIGEMSKMFGLNKQTLHYYDKINIFKPKLVNENGHRLYKFDQCYELASICNMRYLGYSLKKVRNVLEKKNYEDSINKMVEQHKIIEKEIFRLNNLKKAIERKLEFIEEENKPELFSKEYIKYYPKRYYIPIGGENILYKEKNFYYNPTVVFYEDNKKSFGAYIYDINDVPKNMRDKVKEIPEGEYFCAYHIGEYKNINDKLKNIREKNKDIVLSEKSVHFNIIDQFVENNMENFVVLIQLKTK